MQFHYLHIMQLWRYDTRCYRPDKNHMSNTRVGYSIRGRDRYLATRLGKVWYGPFEYYTKYQRKE